MTPTSFDQSSKSPSGKTSFAPNKTSFDLSSNSTSNPLYKPTPTTSNPALPFLAQDFTTIKNKDGTTSYEPFYGGGFTGWARKAVSNVFDPRFLTSNMSEKQKANYQMYVPELESLINKTTLWDSWAGPILGISAKNIAEVAAAGKAETDIGDKLAQSTGIAARNFSLNTLSTVGGLFQAGEYAVRQTVAASKSLHDLADTSDIKANKNPYGNQFWNGTMLEGFSNLLAQANVKDAAFDAYRLVAGNPDWEQADEIFKKNFQSSSAVYSMMWNPMLAAEFERRYKSGEDAYKIAYDIQNPWVEMTAGILLDPLTYLGVGIIGKAASPVGFKLAEHIPFGSKLAEKIPIFNKTLFSVPWEVIARTPEFGDIIGLGKLVGVGRAEANARKFTEIIPELGNILKSVDGKSAEEAQRILIESQGVLDNLGSTMSSILEIKNPYSLFSKRSQDKARAVTYRIKDFANFLHSGTNGNVDETMDILADGIKLLKGSSDEKTIALTKLASRRGFGGTLMSPMAMETYSLVDKLFDNGKILDVLSMSGSEERQVRLFHLLEDALDELHPSVEQMRSAKVLVGTDDFKAKLLNAGENIPAEMQKKLKLAEMYKSVPTPVKGITAVTKQFERVYNPMMRVQGMMFFNLNAAYPIRNFFGNAAPMAVDMGFQASAKALVESGTAFAGKKAVDALSDSLITRIRQILDIEPSKARVGFEKSGAAQLGNKAWGGAAVSSGGEQIASLEIVLQTAQTETPKILKNAVFPELKPQLDAIAQVAGQDTANLLVKSILDSHGNVQDGMAEFLKNIGGGYIESWRHQIPEANLTKLLQKTGSEELFNDILKTSKSPEEMMLRKDELLKSFDEHAKSVWTERPVAQLDESEAEAVQYAGMELEDVYKGGLAAWNQANMHFSAFEKSYIAKVGELYGQGAITLADKEAILKRLGDIEVAFPKVPKSIQEYRDWTKNLISQSRKKGVKIKDLWNESFVFTTPEVDLATGVARLDEAGNVVLKQEIFSLSKAFPNQKPELLDAQKFTDKAWTAYLPIRAQKHTMNQAGRFDAKLAEMRSNPLVNVDELAATMGKGENRVNPLEEANRYRQEAIDYASLEEQLRILGEADSIPGAIAKYAMRFGYQSPVNSMGSDVAKGYQRANLPVSENDLLALVNKYVPPKQVKMPPEIRAERDALESTFNKPIARGEKRPDNIAEMQARAREIDNKYMSSGYEKLDDVSLEDGIEAVNKWATENGGRVFPFNPGAEGDTLLQTPTNTRALYESKKYYESAINSVFKKAQSEWGQVSSVTGTIPSKMLNDFSKAYSEKWNPNKLYIAELANAKRDFILHSYEKTYLDVAMAYIFPYQYWQTRTYSKFMQRVVQDPRLLVNYTRYRNTLSKLHAGMPDWWKQNIPITGLPGIDPDEPLFFNLEATINPMNGLTGTDFNDPYKRVNWWTQVIDDANKFGPSMMMPINWAVALALWKNGEKDASARWAGRLFPQSQMVKSALTLAGVKPTALTPYNEVDPIVNIMSGGLDPYEQRRVHRALAAMVADGTITEEQSYDAAYYKNENWDEAVNRTIKGRAPANMASFFLGVGFKPRTQNDMMIDKFYSEYGKVVQTKQSTSPEAYKNAMSALREKYPFMDTLLISKNYGEERDTSFAYGILSRIPPGQSDDLLKMVGINQDTVDKFYAAKGDMTGMTKPERELFMAAIMNMGAILKIPDNATSVDWNRAKTGYSQIYTDAESMFGKDIWTKVDTYYGHLDQNYQAANDYLDSHPEVQAVFQYKQQAIAGNKDVYKYYGSIDTIQRYYDTLLRQELVAQFGEEIYAQFDEYGQIGLTDSKAAARYYKAHPALKQYGKVKRLMQDEINKTIVKMAENLPDRPNVLLREDIQQPIEVQNQMGEQLNQPQKKWSDWQKELSAPMQRLVVSYFTEGEPLEYAAREQLDYMAGKLGMSGDDLLQQMGVALFDASGMAKTSRLPQQSGVTPFNP